MWGRGAPSGGGASGGGGGRRGGGGGSAASPPPPLRGGIAAWVQRAAGTVPSGGGGGDSPLRSAGAALPANSIPVTGGRYPGEAAAGARGRAEPGMPRLSGSSASQQSSGSGHAHALVPLSFGGVSQASQDSTMATPQDQPIMRDGHRSPSKKVGRDAATAAQRGRGGDVGMDARMSGGAGGSSFGALSASGGSSLLASSLGSAPFDIADMRRSLESVGTDPGLVRPSSDRLDPRGALLRGAPPSVARERAQRSIYDYMTPVPACRVNPYLPALPAGGGRGAKKRSRRSQMVFKDDGVGGGVASRYFGDYEELCLLGRGSYSAVYKVRHRLDGTMYAVKKMIRSVTSEADLQHALNEVFALSVLQSCPYILRYVRARLFICVSEWRHLHIPDAPRAGTLRAGWRTARCMCASSARGGRWRSTRARPRGRLARGRRASGGPGRPPRARATAAATAVARRRARRRLARRACDAGRPTPPARRIRCVSRSGTLRAAATAEVAARCVARSPSATPPPACSVA